MKKIILIAAILFCWFNNQATNYYLMNNTVAVTIFGPTGAWTQDPTGATYISPPANGSGTHVWHFTNRTGATLTGNFSPPNTATASIENGFNLVVSGAFGQLNEKIDIPGSGTLTIANNKIYALNNLDISSTVIYSASSSAGIIQNSNYGNIIIAANCTFSSNASNVWIYNLLTINGAFVMNLNTMGLRLNGSSGIIAGTGSISASGASFVECYGGNGGNNGTIRFTSSSVLDYIYIQFDTPTDYVTLGSNITIDNAGVGTFNQAIGGVDLNGSKLTINAGADISFPLLSTDGSIRSNSTSTLDVMGNIGTYGGVSMFMDATNNTIGQLRVNGGSIFDMGNAININNVLDISGGSSFNTNNFVTLVSTSALKGRLGDLSTGTLNGDITVQTFARGGITDWVNIGVSGVTGESINSGWYGQIPMCIEGSATGVTSANSQYFESVQQWDESVSYYDTLVTVTDALVPGEGYWVFLGNALTTTTDMLWTVSGPAVTGPQPISLTNSGITSAASGPGFNLIANPFPSPINWNSVVTNNPLALINDAYYVYDPDLGNTVSFVNGIATPASGTLTNYQTMADIIPMGQAFYVEATGNTSLTFDEVDKSASNGSNFQLLKSDQSANSIGSPIRLNIDGGGYHDDAVIRFHSNATPAFDKSLDAHKMYGSPGYVGYPGQWSLRTAIATRMNTEDFSINSVPFAQTQNAVIPVVARVYVSGQHTISASELQNLPPGTCVDLKDNYTNTVYDLTTTNFVGTISDTTFYPRFELTVCANNVTADVKTSQISANNTVRISKDAKGVFVKFDESVPVDATIYACNILGQTIMPAKKVKASNETFYLDINSDDQLIFVTVIKGNERTTQKILNIK